MRERLRHAVVAMVAVVAVAAVVAVVAVVVGRTLALSLLPVL